MTAEDRQRGEVTGADVRAAQGGDRAAFGRLVGRYQDLAVGFATGWLRDADAARDAAQDAFIDAYLHLGQLREPAAFAGWLRRIVAKHCDRRTRRVSAVPEVSVEPPGDVEARLAAVQDRRWLRGAIESLPEHERVIVALHYLGDAPQREVAEFMELPLTTVKKRLHSARQKLRERSRDMHALRPSTTPVFADRIQLFLCIRAGDAAGVAEVLDASPPLLDAEEQWTAEEALIGGFPLAHRQSPLLLAAARGHLEIVDLLLARGAAVDGTCGCDQGESPVFVATLHGAEAVVRRLLEAGADPDVPNAVGYGALHVARMRGFEGIAQALLRAGADPTRRAKDGRSPGDWPQPAREALPDPSRPDVITGIKGVDLLAPLQVGMRVRVHAAAETGLMVLLSELTHRLAAMGWRSVWATWTKQPWQKGELESVVREAGIADVVDVVTDGIESVLASSSDHRARFVFLQEGHEAEVEAMGPRLGHPEGLTFIVDPWSAVTRGARAAPSRTAPFDAVLCTDPALAQAGIYPALDLVRTDSRATVAPRHAELRDAVRARADDPKVQACLFQPFVTCQHQTGWAGVAVPLEATLDTFEQGLSGEVRS